MSRVSGNVNANGSKSVNTGNSSGWSSKRVSPGKYTVTFDSAFGDVPSVVLNVINWDCEGDSNQINIGLVPNTNKFDVEFWRNGTYSDQSFSFAAFG